MCQQLCDSRRLPYDVNDIDVTNDRNYVTIGDIYGCDDRQKQCNRNYMVMDDIYVTIRMRHKLCDDRQSLYATKWM